MTDDNWRRSQQHLEKALSELPGIDETITGGRLAGGYVVAEYDFDDHAYLVRLHDTGDMKQTGWRSLGLLTYALEAERQDNFEYVEADSE